MKIIRLDRFVRDYQSLSSELQKKTDKTIRFLLQNPRYPSLQVKKMGGQEIWEARITKGYRLTFELWQDKYVLRRVGPHDILKNP